MNPPAFQLYADDFLAGTADMTAEEVGIYIRLLCHAWNKKGLKNDEKRIGILVGICGGNATASAKEVLASKFELGADGIWRNERQEKTRADQEEYRKTQSNNAHLRWDKVKSAEPNGKKNGHTNGHAVALPSQCSPPPSPTPLNRERESNFAEVTVPSWEEVKTWAQIDGVPEAVAREFFDHENSFGQWRAGGKVNGMPINARNAMKVWFNRGRKTNANNGKTNGASPDRNAGTYNQNRDNTGAKAKIRGAA